MIIEVFVAERLTHKLDNLLPKEMNRRNGSWVGSCTKNGFQTSTLHEDADYQELLAELLCVLPKEFQNLKYRWFHMIDYKVGGWQEEHDHAKTEDYSFVIYLSSCAEGGETVFRVSENQIKSFKPEKNKLVFFPSNLTHWGGSCSRTKTYCCRRFGSSKLAATQIRGMGHGSNQHQSVPRGRSTHRLAIAAAQPSGHRR